MGTTFYHATMYKNGKVDRKAECDAMLNGKDGSTTWTVLKSAMKGSIYYGAVERVKDDERVVYAVIFKTYGQDRSDPYWNFGYKDMDETMNPYYYDCPKTILDLLTPTDNDYAMEWRKKCREKMESTIRNLKVGSQVLWTKWDGSEYVLIKHAPAFQFKTWFWYCPSTNSYVKKALVTDDNIRVVE